MSNPELKITFDLARPGSEKQVTCVRIATEVAQILDQHLAQGNRVEQVNIISQAGMFYLALTSSCNFPKPRVEAPTPEPRRKEPTPLQFCVYAVDPNEKIHLIRECPTSEEAKHFITCCEAHDQAAPIRPRKGTPITKWLTAHKRWARVHPALFVGYIRYFALPKGDPVKEPNRFSVFGARKDLAGAAGSVLIRDFPTENAAIDFARYCVAYNLKRPSPPARAEGDKTNGMASFVCWKQQHPAGSADYATFFVRPIEIKD